MRFVVSFLVVLCVSSSWSQTTDKYNAPYAGFTRAEDLFEKEQFSAARAEFRSFLNEYKGSKNDPYVQKALYYEGISALELFNNDAITLLEGFMKEYPESIYKSTISLQIGRYYYQKKDYPKAIEWFDKLKKHDVEAENVDEYHFKLGYANFHEKQYREAKSAFFEVKESTSQYGAPALYYYSHICYIDSSYQAALEGFQRLLVDDRFKLAVPYYIAQIYHLQGKYEEIVEFSRFSMDSLKPAEKVEMNHIVGDAYYRLGKYDEAVSYLEYYNEKANTTRDDDYQLAMAYSKSADCEKAVKYFDKVARIKDTLGQIALYHAGECYMTLNQLDFAKNAFESAARLNMDAVIEEDALFNFALLSYKLDLNPYDETVEAFEEYLEKYPTSTRKNVIYQYLVNVYTKTKNYQKALESLDRLTSKDTKLKSAYQVIAFNRGVEYYLNSEFPQAISSFESVNKYPVSEEMNAKAAFWIADSYFKNKEYDKSIQKYDAFLAMPATYTTGLRNDGNYNKGYAYLAKATATKTGAEGARDNAKKCFQAYVGASGTDTKKKADAHMRLGDLYYSTLVEDIALRNADDRLAIANYQAAYNLKVGYEDQALYYMSRGYGYVGNKDERIKALLDIINNYPNSKYLQVAVIEVAQAYFNSNNLDKAERYFNQIIADYPSSTFVKEAYHYLGEIAFKRGQYELAEKNYRKVLTDFTNNDEICKREVESLADVYRKQGSISKIEQLSSQFACADSISNQVEDEYYRKAFDLYEDSSVAKALTEFNFYLNKYPNGKYRSDALNYKADILYGQGKEAEAVAIYRETLDGPNNDFTEIASSRTAKLLFNNDQYTEALPYYERLQKSATRPDLLNNSIIGQMRCHFLLENYVNAAEFASQALSTNQSTDVKLEAEFIKGISLTKINRFSEAITALDYVVKNTTKSMGAEAKYTMALGYFGQKDYVKTDALIRELQKMKPKYDYWVAKGLILQTQVLIAQDNLFQAEKTVKSVMDYYPIKDDGIIAEASEWYDQIMVLKSKPKSIQAPDDGTVIDLEDKSGQK